MEIERVQTINRKIRITRRDEDGRIVGNPAGKFESKKKKNQVNVK